MPISQLNILKGKQNFTITQSPFIIIMIIALNIIKQLNNMTKRTYKIFVNSIFFIFQNL